MTTEDTIKKIIAEALEVDVEKITDDLAINGIPEWNSIGNLAIITTGLPPLRHTIIRTRVITAHTTTGGAIGTEEGPTSSASGIGSSFGTAATCG